LEISVPAGTTFFNVDYPRKVHEIGLKGEAACEKIVAAEGGQGGRGNKSLRINNHEHENGQVGQKILFELNLHTLADFSLVGLPNAGKSSLLAALTDARPKIAPYPFTTLKPNVAVLKRNLSHQFSILPTIADIPGLLEGAHRNVGLGHEFLKHILKSKCLILIVDISNPDPAFDVHMLINELELYKTNLSKKIVLVLANKIDRVGNDLAEKVGLIKTLLPHVPVIEISIRQGKNLDAVVHFLLSIENKT